MVFHTLSHLFSSQSAPSVLVHWKSHYSVSLHRCRLFHSPACHRHLNPALYFTAIVEDCNWAKLLSGTYWHCAMCCCFVASHRVTLLLFVDSMVVSFYSSAFITDGKKCIVFWRSCGSPVLKMRDMTEVSGVCVLVIFLLVHYLWFNHTENLCLSMELASWIHTRLACLSVYCLVCVWPKYISSNFLISPRVMHVYTLWSFLSVKRWW